MDEGIEVDDIVSETEDMTLLAQYDAVCRNFDGPGCDTEFSVFAQSQEDCRLKWLRTQNEIARVKFALREAKEYTAKLEALTHHTQSDLKSEINARTRAQKEKRALENQLHSVRDLLKDDGFNEETRKTLNSKLNSGSRLVHPLIGNSPSSQALFQKLNNINDSESSSSSGEGLSQIDQEELELSVVRSIRELARSSKDRPSVGQEVSSLKRTQTSQHREVATSSGNIQERVTTTTTVVLSPDNTISATSKIETFPLQGIISGPVRTPTTRFLGHELKKQTIVSQTFNCVVCDIRVKFGKPAFRCTRCLMICHAECATKIPPDCVSQEPARKGLKSGALKFFSSPSK